jgi:molybdopterin-guanine dinucleotide biosynthesis protein A
VSAAALDLARRGAVVLAGGRSTRMGRDKASLPLRDGTLLSHVVATLREVVGEVVVVSRRGQALPPLPPGLPVVPAHDDVEDRGPLGGLAPGLAASTKEAVYASSCDAPLLKAAFVRTLFERLGDADVAVPEAQGRLHPLAAVWRRSVLPHVLEALGEGRLRPVHVIERVRHVVVPEAVLRAVDPGLDSLRNLNTPADYEEARALIERSGA